LTQQLLSDCGDERVPNLERRAGMHAALGEPARLSVIDRLSLGDASPSELATELGLATNLLAHHLGVLQTAGLIRRVRSEGDRRRNYVQLVTDDPVATALTRLLPGRLTELSELTGGRDRAERIVFVCTHNSARSQLAAGAWRRLSAVPVVSAGTHPAARVHPRAIRTGRRHGLDLTNARTIDLHDVARPGDLLVAVCDNAHEELTGHAEPGLRPQLHWAVPDPVPADTDQAFEAAYEEITNRVKRLAEAVPQP
jgi:protein-tyrosine-phosphatase/DNA-binding transcriptional ArsR family regulator